MQILLFIIKARIDLYHIITGLVFTVQEGGHMIPTNLLIFTFRKSKYK